VLAAFIIGAVIGFLVGNWVGGWRAVINVSRVAHNELMRKAKLRK
jgi:membrane protein DedA with SNARE-associated domain